MNATIVARVCPCWSKSTWWSLSSHAMFRYSTLWFAKKLGTSLLAQLTIWLILFTKMNSASWMKEADLGGILVSNEQSVFNFDSSDNAIAE